jgi:hypothetical protein
MFRALKTLDDADDANDARVSEWMLIKAPNSRCYHLRAVCCVTIILYRRMTITVRNTSARHENDQMK